MEAPAPFGTTMDVSMKGIAMFKLSAVIFATLALAACGGGESSTTANVAVNGTATISAPPISATVTTAGGSTVTITLPAHDYLIKFAGTVDLTITSSTDNVWIAPDQATGNVKVAGDGNNVIFLPGASVVNFLLSGINNTIWVPVGSNLFADSLVFGTNTLKRYTPTP
jgi:hypothetical protein